MALNIVSSNKGIALLLAITVVSLLMAVTLEFNKNMRQELISSANLKDGSQLDAVVKSGYNIAEAVLLQDKKDNNASDSFQDSWAKLSSINFSSFFGKGDLKIDVTDLSGLLQVNCLAVANTSTGTTSVGAESQVILKRLLSSGDFGDLSTEQVDLIVNAITDWVDPDDDLKGLDETESSYYSSLNPPYECKNGPIEFVEELLLVRGVTPELFYGTAETKGLKNFVTAQGNNGKININTAPVELLVALDDNMTSELAESMAAYRLDEANKDALSNPTWYLSAKGLSGFVQFNTLTTTLSSSYFTITATGKNAEMTRTMTSVVRRDSNTKIVMISRKVE